MIYEKDVEALIMNNDEWFLEAAIIKPVCNFWFEVSVKDSSTYVSTEFLLARIGLECGTVS